MPILVLHYRAIEKQVWQVERSGRRLVAQCQSKAMARRIVRALNSLMAKTSTTA